MSDQHALCPRETSAAQAADPEKVPASAPPTLCGMTQTHARFAVKIASHLAAELALHLALPTVATYTLPLTLLYVLVEVWRHVRAAKLQATTKLLPSAEPEPEPERR